MKMTKSTTHRWQDGPFKLMKTPQAQFPDKSKDEYVGVATLMANIHNAWIRALNAIYQVAPHVPLADYKNFVEYAYHVYLAINHHHDEEEEIVFPDLERATGQAGLMATNIEQHAAFEKNFVVFGEYLKNLLDSRATAEFEPKRFQGLVDGFRKPLQLHLEEEIGTLLEARNYPIDMAAFQKNTDEKILARMTFRALRDELPVLLLNHDATYEDGIHRDFPGMPIIMGLVVRRGLTCWRWGWWKYASCTAGQMPKALPYGS